MLRFVNLNIYKNKKYHFDLETYTLKEEVSSPNSWSYVLIPVAIIFFRTIGEVIENTGLFDTFWIRLVSIVVILALSYGLAWCVTKRYQDSLVLKDSFLSQEEKVSFLKYLKRRKLLWTIIQLFLYLVIGVLICLLLSGVRSGILMILFFMFTSLFLIKLDIQLKKWAEVIKYFNGLDEN